MVQGTTEAHVVKTVPVRPATGLSWLWQRQLPNYPSTRRRFTYLAITVLATVVLYYELYVQGAVATKIIAYFGMSFTQFVVVSIVGNLVGAFASLAAGLADRWGRANLVVIGLFTTGFLILVGLPNSGNAFVFLVLFTALSIVEGIILVATPALVRDFSPQLGRASAMGFWTLGPVLGSLVVTTVSSNTLAAHPDWKFQYYVCGIVGVVVAVIALVGLRELSPRLRDQLMVSMRDRALIEARAADVDPEKALKGHWREVLKPDVVGSAFAISVFLLFYYTAVGFFVVYFATVFGYSEARANGLANWYWLSNAAALVVTGFLSDRLRVRKPFMIVGASISIVATAIFATLATRPETSYFQLVVVLMVSAVGGGLAYCAWMANFTETVERRNPAATATGLAVYGGIVRTVVTVSLATFTFMLPAASVLVDQGPRVAAIAAEYHEQIATASVLDPSTLDALQSYPADEKMQSEAVASLLATTLATTSEEALGRLRQLVNEPIPSDDQELLAKYSDQIVAAQQSNPKQWQNWWWVCVAGQVIFLPFVFVTAGRWNPRRAREDADRHEESIRLELEKLRYESSNRIANT